MCNKKEKMSIRFDVTELHEDTRKCLVDIVEAVLSGDLMSFDSAEMVMPSIEIDDMIKLINRDPDVADAVRKYFES